MLVIIGLLLTVLFGLLITYVLSSRLHPVERLGLAYLLGIGLLTYLMFLSFLIGFKFTLINTLFILTLTIITLLVWARKIPDKFRLEMKELFFWPKFLFLEKILIFVLAILFIYSLVNSLYWPVADWDALAIYDFRAKVFAATGSMTEGINRGYFFGYPLLVSLADAWVYLLGGDNPKFIYSLFYISFSFIFYGILRRLCSRRLALFSTVLLATTPSLFAHSMIVYTNLPYTVFLVTGGLYLYLWILKQNKEFLIFSALLMGLSTWTRSTEPFWLTNLIIVIGFSLVKKNYQAIFWYLLFFLLIQQPWRIYESQMIGQNYSTAGQITSSISIMLKNIEINRIKQVIEYLYQNVISSWQPILTLFLLSLVLSGRRLFKSKIFIFLLIILINFLILLGGTYVLSINYSVWQKIPGSAERMSMFFIPLFLFYILLCLMPQKISKVKKE